jgi:hypothetical protein
LVGAAGWLNSDPLTPDELRGSVVLYVFWTYTCINWLRTSSYVRAWAAKYRDARLVVVGVHTPEFVFEQDLENLRSAIAAHSTEFPVVLDNDYPNRPSSSCSPRSARTSTTNSSSPVRRRTRSRRTGTISTPTQLVRNSWALSGEWTARADRVTAGQPGGAIRIRFHARDLQLVMGPGDRGAPVSFRVTIDGRGPGRDHGADVDEAGAGTVTEHRMYQLIRQTLPIDDATAEITFLDTGAQAFVVTFG